MVKPLPSPFRALGLTGSRLNSKVNSRNVAVNDLVTDLSDGVHKPPSARKWSGELLTTGTDNYPVGDTYPSSRNPRE